MSIPDLSKAYKTILGDNFPTKMEISFGEGALKQSLVYQKATWNIDGQEQGLRYGENPDQEAALYRLVAGNLQLGDVVCLSPGNALVSAVELLQSGKHPGKTNLTDADAGLNILRYFQHKPCAIIVKHNNPCGVALGSDLSEAYHKAYFADRVAAFGGCVVVNRELDLATANQILESYVEVVVAPSYASGVLGLFATKPNIRILEIRNMSRLHEFVAKPVLDLKSLIDGGVVAQWSFVPQARSTSDFLAAESSSKGKEYRILRPPTSLELDDMLFGWLVEAGVTSNSVLYVKNGVTVGIGTGEQDRVGVAEIAKDKAYRKLADRLAWERYQTPFNSLTESAKKLDLEQEVNDLKGGIPGSVMVSDAFFPFRDGVDVGLREGVKAVVQPGGSIRDWEVIEACNEAGATMVFTGQRSFRH
jgi:phosphoribosylaminoimidazolecarboxamide formyltransferase/IMP cyclohydrolase